MTVWDRPEPPARPVPLDRERIVAAAIALADEGGLEAVSLRKVAARLDVGPMRLYGYISTKEELFDLMVDEAYAEILPEERPGDWREALRLLACRTRRAALRHEWLADLLGGRPALGPNALAVSDTTLDALDGLAGLDTVMRAVETVSAYFIGAIRREVANLRAERATGLSDRDWQRASGPHVTRMLATGRFPALAKFVHDGTEVDAETSFTTGLDWVLDAVAAKLAPPPIDAVAAKLAPPPIDAVAAKLAPPPIDAVAAGPAPPPSADAGTSAGDGPGGEAVRAGLRQDGLGRPAEPYGE